MGNCGINSSGSGYGLAAMCEHSNDTSGSIRYGVLVD
jgi:hypothetical protein